MLGEIIMSYRRRLRLVSRLFLPSLDESNFVILRINIWNRALFRGCLIVDLFENVLVNQILYILLDINLLLRDDAGFLDPESIILLLMVLPIHT